MCYKQGNSLICRQHHPHLSSRTVLILFFCQFGSKEDAEFDTFCEAGFFVVPAKGCDDVDDVVQLSEGLAGQLVVETFKV